MKNIFNMNNPVWSFIGKLIDVFILQFLWVICCIPIVTFGPATISLYFSLMKTAQDSNPKYVRNYFKLFKENLRNGIPLGLVMLIVGGLIVYAIIFYSQNANYSGQTWIMFLKWAMIGFGFIYLLAFQYVWALSARFVNTTGRTIKNGVLLALRYFWWSMLMILVDAFPWMILYISNFLPILVVSVGLPVFINAYILNKILDPLIRQARKEQGLDTEGQDENEDEEGRYSEEELAAASEWRIPKELSSSGYTTAADNVAEETAETVSDAAEKLDENV